MVVSSFDQTGFGLLLKLGFVRMFIDLCRSPRKPSEAWPTKKPLSPNTGNKEEVWLYGSPQDKEIRLRWVLEISERSSEQKCARSAQNM